MQQNDRPLADGYCHRAAAGTATARRTRSCLASRDARLSTVLAYNMISPLPHSDASLTLDRLVPFDEPLRPRSAE